MESGVNDYAEKNVFDVWANSFRSVMGLSLCDIYTRLDIEHYFDGDLGLQTPLNRTRTVALLGNFYNIRGRNECPFGW
jgi:hypothetical protein